MRLPPLDVSDIVLAIHGSPGTCVTSTPKPHLHCHFNIDDFSPSITTSSTTTTSILSPAHHRARMSSYLEKQSKAFQGALNSAASKLSNPASKSSGASKPPPEKEKSPSPPPATDAAANKDSAAKRKRDGPVEVYSQPQLSGYGNEARTQMTFAVDYLKGKKGEPKSVADVIGHLSLGNVPEQHKRLLIELIREHPRVDWKPDASLSEQTWQTGSFTYRPKIPGVKDKTSLLAYLQRKPDASHTSVKELEDGWPDVKPALDDLERAHKVLLVRTAKDQAPRNVWIDDQSLHHRVDPEFRVMWGRVQLPDLDDMHRKLVAVGQKPASDDPRKAVAGGPAKPKQKKKAGKRITKATNVHMNHLLKDYSDKRR